MNTFGNFFRITTAGESHGKANVVIVDNCPPNMALQNADIQRELDRRKPGQSSITTPRKENDTCEILSGIFEGKTTGTPIAVIVRNENQKSQDYDDIKDVFRPSHADFGYFSKYGIRDHRGGGRASARETIARVIGGAIAKKVLVQKYPDIKIFGFTSKVGEESFSEINPTFIEKNPLRMASKKDFEQTLDKVEKIRDTGNSIGGEVTLHIENPPLGLGSPVFGKLEAELARAMMSVPATKYFEIGNAQEIVEQTGKEANDPFVSTQGKVHSDRNENGGILGGITTGDTIFMKIGIKPTSSIALPQKSVDKNGQEIDLLVTGRHDPILVPRAVPILEAMAAMTLLDHAMLDWGQNHFL
jgi:chorismate synthase